MEPTESPGEKRVKARRSAAPSNETFDFLSGGGEMGHFMRAKDWATTALGDPATWPQSLRTSVSTCLNCSFPILVWWGPELVKLYNDAYAPIIGVKHPSALGARGQDVWPEIWDIIGPMLDRVVTKGEASPADDLLLMLERHGYAEECYFSFSYSPIRDETGGVGGVFCPVIETTARVIGERRLRLQRRLAEELAALHSVAEICVAAVRCLSEDDHRDFPFVALYQVDKDQNARLTASAGLEPDHPAFPAVLPLVEGADHQWRLSETADGRRKHISTEGVLNLPRGPWDRPPTYSVVLPLGTAGASAIFMIAGLNPSRPPEETGEFAERLAQQISASVTNALSVEAERRRAEELAKLDRRNQFFLKLTDRLGGLSDPREIAAAVAEMLGRHLGVSRTGYGEVSADQEIVTYETGFATGVAPLIGMFPLNAFGPANIAELQHGVTTTYADMTIDPRTIDADFAAIETRAAMAVPLIRDGRLRAVLYLNHWEVREWTPDEVVLVREVAARTWDALERARVEAELLSLNMTLEERVRSTTTAREEALAHLHEAQKVETLGQLTGGVAHDFNNLLTPIMGGLDILSRKLAHDERAQRIASGAMQSAERARTLIQRLLSFGRRQTLQSRAVALAELVEGMRDMIERSIGPSIQITVDVPAGLPAVEIDPNQFELAILNLCVNARDAMEGGGRLTIAAARVDSSDGSGEPECVAFRVSDTGKGMDEATLARATQPFFTTKGVGQGTGLGLSMVYGLAAQSGGKLTLTSAVGEGTTVQLMLPVANGPAEIKLETDAPIIEQGSGTILLVDDEELVRMSIADGLRDLGYKVVETASAAGALEHLRVGMIPDVLVTDHMMPGMTGAMLAREARGQLPSLPVLMITGYANLRPDETRGLEVIAKPFHRGDLAARISDLMKDHQVRGVASVTKRRTS